MSVIVINPSIHPLLGDVSSLENTAALEVDVKAKAGLKINTKLEAFNQRFSTVVSLVVTQVSSRQFFDFLYTKISTVYGPLFCLLLYC